MWRALLRVGEQVGRGRVERPRRSNDIQGAKRRGKPWRTTYPNANAYRPADLVERDFTASRPDELWFADFTYLRCWEGVVYFAFVIDAYSRQIVGWQFAAHMRTDLVLDALRMALTLHGPGADVALVHHSDAGSQGGFNSSSQHLVMEVGGDGCWGASAGGSCDAWADVVAGATVGRAAGGSAAVLAGDCRGLVERRRGRRGGGGAGGWAPGGSRPGGGAPQLLWPPLPGPSPPFLGGRGCHTFPPPWSGDSQRPAPETGS